EFAARRLRGERIGTLTALRLGEPGGNNLDLGRELPPDRVHSMPVAPLSLEAIGQLVRERLGAELPRPVMQRIHQAGDGNPFFCLEIAREVIRRGVREPGEALPVPDDLHDLLRGRLEALPKAT